MADAGQTTGHLTMAFASPILRIPVPDADRLNATLIKEAYDLKARSPGIRRSNRQGWHSDSDLMSRTEPGLSELARFIKKAINTATKSISPQFAFEEYRLLAEGWININPQHGYNVPHSHSGFMWSGCYYVTIPEAVDGPSGSIEFLSPLIVPGEYSELKAACYKDRVTMRPNAGDVLLFPSYLTHWVFPNEADADRITIAFNGAYVPRKTAD